jgi:tetratricopeptide (TPR) repeat protein
MRFSFRPLRTAVSASRAWRPLAAAVFALLPVACATVPQTARTPSHGLPRVSVAAVAPADDLLLKLIAGQFAAQDGDLATAAARFAEAARLSPDPAVAEQATQLALAARDWDLARAALTRWRQLAPAAVGPLQAEAWIALGQDDTEAATTHLLALLGSGDEQAWRMVAQSLLAANDKAAAARVLSALASPERLGSRETAWLAVSQLAFKLEDRALADRLADEAVERFHSADTYGWKARLALDRGDRERARAVFAEGVRRSPADTRLRGGYAALLAETGDNAGAARVLAAGPQDDTIFAARAAYAARADDKKTLAALYREVQADKAPRGGLRLYLLGQLAELSGKAGEARDWYREVPREDERWFDAQTRQAILLDEAGRTDEAVTHLRALEPNVADDAEQLGSVFLIEADLLKRRDRKTEALASYQRGLNSLPDDGRLLYARAMLAIELEDVAAAEADLRRMIVLDPDDPTALNALGYTLADMTDRSTEALALIERAIALKPDEPTIIDSLGWVQYRLGRLDEAVATLRRAYEKLPDPEIAAHLGEVLWVSGQREEARRVWNEARRADPDNSTLVETIRRLDS